MYVLPKAVQGIRIVSQPSISLNLVVEIMIASSIRHVQYLFVKYVEKSNVIAGTSFHHIGMAFQQWR